MSESIENCFLALFFILSGAGQMKNLLAIPIFLLYSGSRLLKAGENTAKRREPDAVDP